MGMTSIEMLDGDFATLPDLVRAYAAERPDAVAAADPLRRLSWSELDQLTDRIAARLQQDGFAKGERTAICSTLLRPAIAVRSPFASPSCCSRAAIRSVN